MEGLHALLALRHADTFAFAATLLCVWISAQAAVRAPRRSPRLLTSLALFAFNWAILLLYYLPGPPPDEMLSAFSGFALIYAGLLLLREARAREPQPGQRQVSWIDTVPLHLLRVTVTGFG